MRKTLLVILALQLVLAGIAGAAAKMSFNETLSVVQGHLDSGEYDKALELLHELQVDHPDSPIVAYGIGKALYARAEHQETLGAKDEASASYAEAETAFGRTPGGPKGPVATEAAFARLNAAARKALLVPEDAKYDEAVSALRGAVSGYEQFLREHPGHAGARQNLDHVSLKLKELLQKPPEPQQQQDQKQQPQENRQPIVYFMNAGTEIPKAQAKAEGNQLELVVPGTGGAKP